MGKQKMPITPDALLSDELDQLYARLPKRVLFDTLYDVVARDWSLESDPHNNFEDAYNDASGMTARILKLTRRFW
ncbi:MAG: hypothetical protein GTN49_10725 [candidate division Zixibacteria bacterium]|nr:hypothetical protein [candidate division Zixibacteria bacterium]